MAEMFGCKNRFTRMAISKEIGGLIASGFGPILAGIFCTMTESWYPIAIMIMAYSVIGLISALKMPEVKDRDLSALEDAAEDQPRVVRAAQPSRSLYNLNPFYLPEMGIFIHITKHIACHIYI